MAKDRVVMRYKGGGFLPPFPARDLRESDVRRHGRAALLASGLYEEIKPVVKPAKEEVNVRNQKTTVG